MNDNTVVKLIEVSGPLKSDGCGHFELTVDQNNINILEGAWKIALSDITIVQKNGVPVNQGDHFISVHTNWVTAKYKTIERYDYDIVREMVPLQKLHIVGERDTLIHNSPQLWFKINRASLKFEVFTRRYVNKNDTFMYEVDCVMTFCLRRMR